MRRPILFVFTGFTGGIALEFYAGFGPLYLILGFALAFILFLLGSIPGTGALKSAGMGPGININKDRLLRVFSLYMAITLWGSFCFSLHQTKIEPLKQYEGQGVKVMGQVLTVKEKSETYHQLTVKATHYLDEKEGVFLPCKTKWLVQVKGKINGPEDYIGKTVTLSGRAQLPTGARNPGLFDYRLYLRTLGIQAIIQSNLEELQVFDGTGVSPRSLVAELKYGFLNRIQPLMEPEAYGIFIGMLFGDVTHMEEDLYEAFQKNGIGHILSVSGIHVTLVYLYISKLFPGRNGLSSNGFAIGMLILYAALSEFSPPVVRAVLMIIIHILSKMSYHRYDFTTCIAVSGLIMLVKNPYYLFNTGFQLTYLAVFCLAFLLPWTKEIEEKGKEKSGIMGVATKTLAFLAPLFAIQLGMLPLTAYLFNYFSLTSFFMNIPIMALSGAIIPIGITLIPIAFFGEGLILGVGLTAAALLIDLMTWLNDFFYLPGKGFFHAISPSLGFVFIYYGLLFFLSSEMNRILYKRKRFKTIATSLILFMVFALVFTGMIHKGYHEAALTFVDVGQGDCLHIRTPGGKNILIDGGGNKDYNVGKKVLLPYLLKNGVSHVDLVIVTHLHEDHYLGIVQLAGELGIKKLGLYESNKYGAEKIAAETGLEKKDLLYLTGGMKLQIEEGIWIDVLYPEKKTEAAYENLYFNETDENKSSLLLLLNYKGLRVMMTGDMDIEGESQVLAAYKDNPSALKAHVLKVGHHGSKNSTGDAFLDAVQPETAMFQVGKNNIYGHPHGSVIEKCENRDIMVYRNDTIGAIIFDEQEQRWQVRTML